MWPRMPGAVRAMSRGRTCRGTPPPPSGLDPGWAPRPRSAGVCRCFGGVRREGRHWWQGVRAQGHTGPPHFLRLRSDSARPQVELNRGTTVRRRQGAQAPHALQHRPPVVTVPPFRGMAVRSAGLRVQQVQATCGKFLDELGVGGPTTLTWARARRVQRWAWIGLQVAAPQQEKGRPSSVFPGEGASPLWKSRGWPFFRPPPTPCERDTQARQRVVGSREL